MSRWIGTQAGEVRLADAARAFSGAAYTAGAPGWIWFAGLFYPSLTMLLGMALSESSEVKLGAGMGFSWHSYGIFLLLGPLLLFPLRLQAGLAIVMQPAELAALPAHGRRTPKLSACWRSSRGLLGSTLSLWLRMAFVLLVGLSLVVVPPWFFLKGTGLKTDSIQFLLYISPFFALAALFQLTVAMLYQLALQSMVRHRRGASAALTHAWRIASHRPWATFRAIVIDLLLTLMVMLLTGAIVAGLALTIVGILLIPVAIFALPGIEGCARAGYWARMYLALGGMPAEKPTGKTAEQSA